ncbi:CG9125 [Drosophila busckii]|uniref:Decapping nuclease n=1 Tax=Drosophila busckii TaxID=30019 RepID=A0A0M4F9E9_DROBS|nr:decapping nuclease DXO homolog [Drosophila busckii]ALC49162.1 CG9125 [Drosophila busckii]
MSSTGTLHLNIRTHKLGTPYSVAFPNFSRPEPVGCYSINESRELEDNANNAGYLRIPPQTDFPLDLNAGIEQVQRKPPEPDYHDIAQLCRYISLHPKLLQLQADVITFRGILRQIMGTPYERQKDYCLVATLFHGSIYLAKLETPEQREERQQMPSQQQDMCSWGFKFEQYCTTHDPQEKPITDVPVNESKEFACIYSSKLNGLKLLYGAEMDCIKSTQRLDLRQESQLRAAQFVELKTSALDMNFRQQRSFDNYKSSNWWCQSYLVGIGSILAGLRDPQGMLHEIKEYDVRTLHRNKPWSAAAMANFLYDFLHELKTLMAHLNTPEATVRLDFKAAQSQVYYTVLKDEQVLPTWYRQQLSNN